MNETQFRPFAKADGYREPDSRSLPANKFFETHAHDEDLIVLINAGFRIDRGELLCPYLLGHPKLAGVDRHREFPIHSGGKREANTGADAGDHD